MYKDADTGKFISKEYYLKNPKTTYMPKRKNTNKKTRKNTNGGKRHKRENEIKNVSPVITDVIFDEAKTAKIERLLVKDLKEPEPKEPEATETPLSDGKDRLKLYHKSSKQIIRAVKDGDQYFRESDGKKLRFSSSHFQVVK